MSEVATTMIVGPDATVSTEIFRGVIDLNHNALYRLAMAVRYFKGGHDSVNAEALRVLLAGTETERQLEQVCACSILLGHLASC